VLNTVRSKKEDHVFEPSDFFPQLASTAPPAPDQHEAFVKFKGIMKDLGMRARPAPMAPPSGPPLLPLSALPSRAMIEAKLRG
jgi:hypothetical protein